MPSTKSGKTPDMSEVLLTFGNDPPLRLPKNRAMLATVTFPSKRGISPEQIERTLGKRPKTLFVGKNGKVTSDDLIPDLPTKWVPPIDDWFLSDEDLIFDGQKTWTFRDSRWHDGDLSPSTALETLKSAFGNEQRTRFDYRFVERDE